MENWEIAELKKKVSELEHRLTVYKKDQMDLYDLIIGFFKFLLNIKNQKLWQDSKEEEEDA